MAFSKAKPHLQNMRRVSKKLSLHEWLSGGTSKKHIKILETFEAWTPGISTTVVFNVFGTRNRFHEDSFSMDWEGMVSEWFKSVTFSVHFNSIITSAPSQVIIRFWRLGTPTLEGTKMSSWLPSGFSGQEASMQCRVHWLNPWSAKIPHATGQLRLCTTEAACSSPRWEIHTWQLESSPCLPQLEKNPCTAMKTQCSQKYKLKKKRERSRGVYGSPRFKQARQSPEEIYARLAILRRLFHMITMAPCAFYSPLMRGLLTTMTFLRRLLFFDVLNCLVNIEGKMGVGKKCQDKSRGKKVTCLVNVFSWKSIRSVIFWKGHGQGVSWNMLPLCSGLGGGGWEGGSGPVCLGRGGRNWPLSPESAFSFTLLCM